MWPRFINMAVGVWLMAAPGWLDLCSDLARDNDHIVGPILVTFATIALHEATRPCRWVVFLSAVWLLTAPFVLAYWMTEPKAAVSDIISACLCMIFALVPGKVTGSYGGGWSMLRKRGSAALP